MAVARLQQKLGSSGAPVASIVITFDSTTAAGNLIVVSITGYKAGSASTWTVTDNKGNTYTSASRGTGVGSFYMVEQFYAKDILAGASHQITVTPDTTQWVGATIAEYSGADTAAPLDQTANATGTSTNPLSGSVTTTSAGLITGCFNHTGATTSITPDAGWDEVGEVETDTPIPLGVVDKIAAVGTYNPSWTLGASRNWGGVTSSYKESAAAGHPAARRLGGVIGGRQMVGRVW